MNRKTAVFASIILMIMGIFIINLPVVYAAEGKETLQGKTFDLEKKDAYDIDKAKAVSGKASRFYLSGDISEVSEKNGFVSYAVNSGNLKIKLDQNFAADLFKPRKEQDWHIITDKTKAVDTTKLEDKIESGAIIVQISRDGKAWINTAAETDIYEKLDTLNKRTINGEQTDAFYETTNVQITSGCYYRIIVAYKLERTVAPSKILFVKKKNTEQKERMEIYKFYAYNPNVDQSEELDIKEAYEFNKVFRVDSSDGFKEPTAIKSEDPHNDWTLGKFYVSGYTSVMQDGSDCPVFLKVPGDKAALWFNLEYALDKCNGRKDVKVDYIESGSDLYFGTPTISNWGRGTLIIRKTDQNNKQERYIYTNYLEASASAGANTRIDLFEEGDYEVALDYQLHYDKPFVFGKTTTKTLAYQMFFKFKVRNGDISAFIRDIDTNQFITNANIAENGFFIDVANSQYLSLSIKREVMSESLDGLVEDTKFSGVAKEGRPYTEEGIYTVTVKNSATGDSIEKKVYVGDSDILKAHVATGISISEINERIAAGAYIDENGSVVDPVPEETEPESEEVTEAGSSSISEPEQENSEADADSAAGASESVETEKSDGEPAEKQADKAKSPYGILVAISIIAVFAITLAVKKKKETGKGKGADAE